MQHRKGKRKFETEVDGKYVVDKLLGEGGFCIVFKAHHKISNQIVAVKRMDKTKPLYRKFNNATAMERLNQLMYREADVMRALKHENIMQLVDFIDNGTHIYLVLEFAEGGELYNKLLEVGRFKEYYAAMITHQVMEGLRYMHQLGYVHRDIKAENVLFRDKESCKVIITDFGLSKRCLHTLHTNCGTLVYSAPELLRNKQTKKGYDKKVDNWAVGVLLYLLLSGKLPFDDPQFHEGRITQKIMKAKPPFHMAPWNTINKYGIKLIQGLLEREPQDRMELEAGLKHPFMRMHVLGEKIESKISDDAPKSSVRAAYRGGSMNCQKLRVAILYISIAYYIEGLITSNDA